MIAKFIRILACLAATLGLAASAAAAAGPWATADNVKARLISAVDATGTVDSIPVGLEVELKPGWKTYWRSPGDAGLPPTLDWAGSKNAKAEALKFPVPTRFTITGLETFGYHDEVVFPITVKPAEPGKPVSLAAKLDILVCEKICVPQTLVLKLDLPSGAATPGAQAPLLSKFTSQVPGDGTASGLAVTRVRAVGNTALEITATSQTGFSKPDVFPESDISFGNPKVALSADKHAATITLPVSGKLPPNASIAAKPVTLTLVDGPLSMERKVTPEAGAPASAGERLAALMPMILLALLGGLILNLMPCVLPVLSLKLISVVSRGGQAHARIRRDFLATAAGIVFSFLVLAAGLIVLRLTGSTIGWGIQFQQPVFIAVMVALSALFACNMWGFFEIPMPGFVAERAGAGHEEGLTGHFMTGAFATLLATPCSAPFLGTAVGFALAGGVLEILAIFMALGVGLAAPYLLVALRPGLAAAMPRPGKWMLTLKHVLGFALIATSLWLLWILAGEQGTTVAVITGLLVAAIVAVLGLRKRLAESQRPFAAVAAAALAVAAIAVPAVGGAALGIQPAPEAGNIAWVPFDRDKAKSLVSQGKTVFVDVTADWCLTCQANKRLVLDRATVSDGIKKDGVISMKADWTRPDPKISAFLASYGKFGIPFNIVYGPGSPGGVVLPEILTEKGVLDALQQARRSTSTSSAAARTF